MVKTRSDLKIKVREVVERKTTDFTTAEISESVRVAAPNMITNPRRLTKFIQATGIATYNKTRKHWQIKTKPRIKK